MRLAVTGTMGQVARSLADLAEETGVEIVLIGRPELDLADAGTILPALEAVRPDAVVSAAAYTAVDKAESERDMAFAINAQGAGAVSGAARLLGIPVVHLSTDYVFDGLKRAPYVETDPAAPQSVYGASKLEGERLVAMANPDHLILRTSWVYSPHGSNFLKTMLRLGETRRHLDVVADQHGCPTSAEVIARAVILAAGKMTGSANPEYRGIFHLAGSGEASWADFARHIFATATIYGRDPVTVGDISADQYPSIVKRPANSRLSTDAFCRVYETALPDWRHSVSRVVRTLLESRAGSPSLQMASSTTS